MKLHNLHIIAFVLTLIFLGACTDDYLKKSNSLVEEGVPVSLSINFDTQASSKIQTRALTDDQSNQVNDLYVLIFDVNNQRKGGQYFGKDEFNSYQGYGADKPTTGTVQLPTTSGISYICAVANVKANALEDLESKLDEIDNLNALKQLTARLSSSTDERPSANLLMSGVYKASGNDITDEQREQGYCLISEHGVLSTGKIALRRLDSHIKFQINVKNSGLHFTPKSYQIFKMPLVSNVLEQATEASKSEADYFDSKTFVKFDNNSFDFYMLENLKESKSYDGSVAQKYSDREKQEKTEGGSYDKPGQSCENGEYLYADEYATYVEIKGAIVIEGDGGAVTTADVIYTIHLGYVNNDAADFKSKRNGDYLYNVTIAGVDDIILEVTRGDETAPGAEGDVIEASENIYELDAHFHAFIIKFNQKKVGNSLNYQVVTPFATVSSSTISTAAKKDIDWVKFKRNNFTKGVYSRNLERFPSTAAKLKNVSELSADINSASTDKDGNVYYTVFVNDYYYDAPPTGCTWSMPYWRNFVNQPDRKMMLIYEPQYSPDGESSYATAEYLIKQQSIQTYYSTNHFNGSQTAIGVEHINENGTLSWGSTDSQSGSSVDNGKENMWKQLGSKTWSTFLTTTPIVTANNLKVFNYTLNSSYEKAYAACLQRNRDENGDGNIDKNELKWYLPARDQLINVYMGAESLRDPIYDHTKYILASPEKHFFTSSETSKNNVWKIWAEEGASTGSAGKTETLDFRCVRNLGTTENVADKYYNYKDLVFTLDGMDELSVRSSFVANAEIAPHHNFEKTNLPYTKFRVAKSVVKDNEEIRYVSDKEGWWTMNGINKSTSGDNGNSYCSQYSEYNYGKGTWRTPNQRELLLMYMENLHNYGTVDRALYSRTAWKFDLKRHFGTHNVNNANVSYLSGESPFVNTAVRCVQDIK